MKIVVVIFFIFWITRVIQTISDPEKVDTMLENLLRDKGIYDPDLRNQFKHATYVLYILLCVGVMYIFCLAYTSL